VLFGEAFSGDLVVGGVEVDTGRRVPEVVGGHDSGARTGEGVKDVAAEWASGGDAAQRDADGECGVVVAAAGPGGQHPHGAGVTPVVSGGWRLGWPDERLRSGASYLSGVAR
jgi:hypothetical protein